MRKMSRVNGDHGKHDRRQSAGAEPPKKRNRVPPRAAAEHRQRHGQHADQGEAEDRVQRHLPAQVLERGPEQDRSKHQKGDPAEQSADLFAQSRGGLGLGTGEAPEQRSGNECGYEAGAAERGRDGVCQRRRGHRHDLQPRPRDQVPFRCEGEQQRRYRSDADPGEYSVPDLLHHDRDGVMGRSPTGLGVGGGERNQKQRHADAVVETALDVEPLADSRR